MAQMFDSRPLNKTRSESTEIDVTLMGKSSGLIVDGLKISTLKRSILYTVIL